MKRLRGFHEIKLKVNHEFDIFGQMEFYETLWEGTPSIYKDYEKTKANVLSLKPYIDAHTGEKVLTHIDAVPDNFLFVEKDGKEEIRLIDWEYAGMQDPHVDVAMFCIYSLYNKRQVDRLIAAYFTEGCDDATRIKIYCYIAACGLLWSNWCEYKRNLGVEFGEYCKNFCSLLDNRIWATRKNPDFILLIPRFRENAAAFTTLLAELCSMMLCIRCSRGLVTVSADRRTVGSVLCGCAGIVLVCTGVKALALPNLICILAAVLGSVAAYAVILLGMKNPLVLEYLEKVKQKFRKTS